MVGILGTALDKANSVLNTVFDLLGRLRARAQFGAKGKVSVRAHIHNPEQVSVGDGSTICHHSHIGASGSEGIQIGEDSTFHEYGYMSGQVTIGDGVRIANKVSIHSNTHRYADPDTMIHEQGSKYGTVTIEDDVWIGTGVRILQDVTIGEGAVIAAGAVVNDDVEPYTVVGGVPAEPIGSRK